MSKIIIGTIMLLMIQTSVQAETPTHESVTKLYVATFNRAPLKAGLDYWVYQSGLQLEDVAQSFFDQDETKAKYPADATVEDFVIAVYANLFNREPAPAGLKYWGDEINSGLLARSVFILAVINGAQDTEEFGNDAMILANKTIIGLSFAMAGLDDRTDAFNIMTEITDDDTTVTAALDQYGIDEFVFIGADYMSSYENSKTSIYINYYELPIQGAMLRDAIAYLDADGDGDIDVFMGTGVGLLQGEVDSVLSINDGTESFNSSTSEFSDNMPPATHARKTLVSDFNGDGLKDMLILDHGYDAEPFPGAQPKLIIQDSLGVFSWSKLPEIGFNHGGAAGDIDNDGDIDIFITDHKDLSGNGSTFYINDGNANFTKNITLYDNGDEVIYNTELIDIDKDGFIDLLTGAHEREGQKTSIYWGNKTSQYTTSNRTIIPALPPMGVICDFDAEDIDGDGDRDLVINRTRDGDDGGGLGFYVGRTTQLLRNNGNRSFTDITATSIDNPGGDTDQWVPWLRVQDFDGDGDMDIRPDNAALGFEYINDGTGNFTKHLL